MTLFIVVSLIEKRCSFGLYVDKNVGEVFEMPDDSDNKCLNVFGGKKKT